MSAAAVHKEQDVAKVCECTGVVVCARMGLDLLVFGVWVRMDWFVVAGGSDWRWSLGDCSGKEC